MPPHDTPIPVCPHCYERTGRVGGKWSPQYFLCPFCDRMVNAIPIWLGKPTVAALSRWLDAERGRTFDLRKSVITATGAVYFHFLLLQDTRRLSSHDHDPDLLVRRTIMKWENDPALSLPYGEWFRRKKETLNAASND